MSATTVHGGAVPSKSRGNADAHSIQLQKCSRSWYACQFVTLQICNTWQELIKTFMPWRVQWLVRVHRPQPRGVKEQKQIEGGSKYKYAFRIRHNKPTPGFHKPRCSPAGEHLKLQLPEAGRRRPVRRPYQHERQFCRLSRSASNACYE